MRRVVFYEDHRGCPVAEYLAALGRAGETSALATFERRADLLAEHGVALGLPYSRIIDRQNRLFELRFGDHRAAYCERGEEIVLLNAWRKRSQKLDQRAANRARRLQQSL